jgi:hypothetical protein
MSIEVIDGREMRIEDVLIKLRNFLNSRCSLDESVEVLVRTREDAKKVKGFAAMSGCETKFKQQGGYCSMLVSGGSCRCGM